MASSQRSFSPRVDLPAILYPFAFHGEKVVIVSREMEVSTGKTEVRKNISNRENILERSYVYDCIEKKCSGNISIVWRSWSASSGKSCILLTTSSIPSDSSCQSTIFVHASGPLCGRSVITVKGRHNADSFVKIGRNEKGWTQKNSYSLWWLTVTTSNDVA